MEKALKESNEFNAKDGKVEGLYYNYYEYYYNDITFISSLFVLLYFYYNLDNYQATLEILTDLIILSYSKVIMGSVTSQVSIIILQYYNHYLFRTLFIFIITTGFNYNYTI